MIDALTANPMAWAAARALVAFVWQGAIIGAATAVCLVLLRRRSAHARYLVACAGLAILCAAPVITGFQLFDSKAVVARIGPTPPDSGNAAAIAEGTGAPPSIIPIRPSVMMRIATAGAWINTRLPSLLLVWAAGVFVFGLRLGRGWIKVARIRGGAHPIGEGRAVASAARIARTLGVRHSFDLLSSARVAVPTVIGWIRPAILFPVGLLAGMSTSHLEAILAHELAHIRRSDFLVNVLQCTAEVLLFYHPAVWWVSRQIRIERELRADDLAVALSGDRVTYAHALASVESLRTEPIALAMVSGDDLLTRVRRLIEPDVAPRPRIAGGLAMTVALLLLVITMAGIPANPSAASVSPAIIGTSVAGSFEPLERSVTPSAVARVTTSPARARSASAASKSRTNDQIAGNQASNGSVTGTVRDADGGVVPGVTISIVATTAPGRLNDPVSKRAITNARGVFTIEDLPPGEYQLTASIIGFRTSRSRLQVRPNARESIVLRLEIGSLSETVTVRSGAPANRPMSDMSGRTAADYLDLAKTFYQQGRYANAEEMTRIAVEMMRSQIPMAAAAPASEGSGPIRVGGSIREPKKIRDVKPVYPPIAQSAEVQGTVIIEAIIGKDGSVKEAKVLRPVPMLDQAALDAVLQWQYTPTLLNGQPVEVVMTVTVTFLR